jgi:hypothetical protein
MPESAEWISVNQSGPAGRSDRIGVDFTEVGISVRASTTIAAIQQFLI